MKLFAASLFFLICAQLFADDLSYVVVPVELRQEIKTSVLKKANTGLEKIIKSARNNGSVPNDLIFLIDIAKSVYARKNIPLPDSMNASAVLSAFASQAEALDAIETHYRNEAFHVFIKNKSVYSPEVLLNNTRVTFHILDEHATAAFNNYYKKNGATTFNADGRLNNPSIPGVPADVSILGVFDKDRYGLDEQQRNPDGTLKYVAIKNDIGLDGGSIRSATVGINQNTAKAEVLFSLNNNGSAIFYQLTSSNIGKSLVVVFDNKIIAQAAILSAIYDHVSMSGFDIETAIMLSRMLGTGDN